MFSRFGVDVVGVLGLWGLVFVGFGVFLASICRRASHTSHIGIIVDEQRDLIWEQENLHTLSHTQALNNGTCKNCLRSPLGQVPCRLRADSLCKNQQWELLKVTTLES